MRPPLHLESAVSQSWVGLGWGLLVVVVRTDDLTHVFVHTRSVGAPNWSGRTPESQTPGVPAIHEPSTTNSCWPSRAGLDVQLDGARKMPQLVVVVVVVVVVVRVGVRVGEVERRLYATHHGWLPKCAVSSFFVFPQLLFLGSARLTAKAIQEGVQALANGEMLTVARFFFRDVARGGFSVARSALAWLFLAFFLLF